MKPDIQTDRIEDLTEAELFARVSRGDKTAEQEVVRRNLPLVRSVARTYKTPGADFDDLVQEGATGLVRAIRKFEPERGFKFSTYAHWWIRQAISRFVKGPTRIIRIPEYVHDEISRLHQVREQHVLETGASPTEKELERSMAWKEGRVRWLDELSSDASSLDAGVREGQGLTVGAAISGGDTPDPEAEADRNFTWGKVVDALKELPDRQAQILAYRFGLLDGEKRSLAWVGSKIGLSPERVRQLQHSALSTLRSLTEGPMPAAA